MRFKIIIILIDDHDDHDDLSLDEVQNHHHFISFWMRSKIIIILIDDQLIMMTMMISLQMRFKIIIILIDYHDDLPSDEVQIHHHLHCYLSLDEVRNHLNFISFRMRLKIIIICIDDRIGAHLSWDEVKINFH